MESTYRVAQTPHRGASFEIAERERTPPPRGHVRIAVEAAGVCHSDVHFVEDALPGLRFPVVPGHEIAGRIEALGEDVEGWAVGDRAEVGWFGGSCHRCPPCRAGDFIDCVNLQVPGWAYEGGYAESVVVPADAVARIPDALAPAEAASLGCAGVTTYNGLRHGPARPGDLVAVLGIGGLGHLGVQYARAMGFETVAIARGAEKEPFAKELGAHHYLDSTSGEPVAAALQSLGGAAAVLATAADSAAIAATVDGLRPRGELTVVGISPEPLAISPAQLILNSRTVKGHPSGTAQDVEDTMRFSALTGVRPMIETYPLDQAQQAYDRMLSGRARFRVVLTTDGAGG